MKHTILFLAADPSGTDPRALDREARAMQAELLRSGFRERFELVTRWAAEPLDLLRELRALKPTVVHFSGRGGRDGLVFQASGGDARVVSPAAIAEAFGAAGASVSLVVLNACYSDVQADALLAHVDCVVGMSGAIREDAARSFAIGFYGGLGERESVAVAYKQGRAAISLEGQDDSAGLTLKVRAGVDAGHLVLAADPPVRSPGAQTSPQRRQIFISYHRRGEEAQLAGRLRDALSAQGHSIFIDVEMSIGTDWANEIQRQIVESDVFIVLLSEESIAREMVQREVRAAYRRQRSAGQPRILPVRVRYDGPLDYEIECYLGRLHYAQWNGPDDDAGVIEHIARALAGAAPEQPASPGARTAPASTGPEGRPAPAMDPRFLSAPGGTMALHDPLYIRRAGDDEVEALARSEGETLIIKGARQRGKSSLLVRYLAACRERRKHIALIDFQTLSAVELETYPEFLLALAVAIMDALEISAPEPVIRRQMDMNRFLQRTVLEAMSGPLVLAFDEVDRVAARAYKTDFFGMLRSWHNGRATSASPGWQTIDLALVLSTEPTLLIQDAFQSPFNVGHAIELDCLTREQCHEMNRRTRGLGSDEVDELYDLLGGHPYLTRLAYHRVLAGGLRFPIDLRIAADPHGPFGDHLRAMLSKLTAKPDLLAAMQRIIRTRSAEPELVHRLRSVGLVRTDGGVASPANLLYTTFFRAVR